MRPGAPVSVPSASMTRSRGSSGSPPGRASVLSAVRRWKAFDSALGGSRTRCPAPTCTDVRRTARPASWPSGESAHGCSRPPWRRGKNGGMDASALEIEHWCGLLPRPSPPESIGTDRYLCLRSVPVRVRCAVRIRTVDPLGVHHSSFSTVIGRSRTLFPVA